MPIPSYEEAMRPFLGFLSDGKEHSIREAIEYISKEVNLTDNEQKQLTPSGVRLIYNRVAWARTYLGKAELLNKTKRGFFKISERGHQVLKENPAKITDEYLERFPEFVLFLRPKDPKKSPKIKSNLIPGTLIPEFPMPKHNEIRDMLYEIGKFENKIPEVEYPIDNLRLDTVWKTIPTGNPKWAFEVQMGGNFYEALTKLKHAWDKWNSKPFLVTTEIYETQAKALLEGSFHEMREDARIVNWEKVVKLHKCLKEANELKMKIRF
jgi:hypothetical protein